MSGGDGAGDGGGDGEADGGGGDGGAFVTSTSISSILFGSIIGESFNFGLDEGAHVEWMKKYGFDIVDHLTHTQMDKKWNSIHGKTFFENANVPRLIKVELPKKSRLSFGR